MTLRFLAVQSFAAIAIVLATDFLHLEAQRE